MKRQQLFQRRLQTLTALSDAVGAMRSLSAHHFRRARAALPAARQYREEMNRVISEIGIQQPLHASAPTGLLVIASDLGLCGDYNARLSHLAMEELKQQTATVIYCVGRRSQAGLSSQAIVPARTYEAPASLEGLTRTLLRLSQDVMEDYLSLKIGSLHIISAGFEGVGHFATLLTQVLPVVSATDGIQLRPAPYLNRDYLTTVATREYLYITLFEILLDALASEHGMRLMAAESALEWLESTAAITSRRLACARSEASTQELLDIVAGGRKSLKQDLCS